MNTGANPEYHNSFELRWQNALQEAEDNLSKFSEEYLPNSLPSLDHLFKNTVNNSITSVIGGAGVVTLKELADNNPPDAGLEDEIDR